MPNPPTNWLDDLPRERLVAEFSIWSANLIRLADEIARVEPHADVLHVDVADGHFAPSLLFFPDLVAAIRAVTARPIHVHLMVADVAVVSQAIQFADAGADAISVHAENGDAAEAALAEVDRRGLVPGLALKVESPVASVARFLRRVRILTLLGTPIGVKGRGLDPRATDRLAEAARLVDACGLGGRILLAADGGIREDTVPLLRRAGATSVVLGSLAFASPSLGGLVDWLASLR